MTKITWITSNEGEKRQENGIGGTGGFFKDGMRFNDYLEQFSEEGQKLVKQLQDSIIKERIWIGGDGHQLGDECVPMWPDGTVATYSYRAWGDLMAAVWSTEHDKDYNYMSFYMDCLLPEFPES